MISNKLATLCNRTVKSTDQMIEKNQGQTIAKLFKESGEAQFRKFEKEAVQEISKQTDVIIDCGGGVVLDPENISSLKKNGILFFLSASPEIIFDRVKDYKHRPLLACEDPLGKIRDLLQQRAPLYQKADHEIHTDNKTIDQVCEEIIQLMGK